jgi:DNA-binding GntR family transcriptional regulator
MRSDPESSARASDAVDQMQSDREETGRAAYQVLRDELRKKIISGQLASGDQLPTELELCTTYGLSRQTIRRSLQGLVNEGLLYRIRGQGTFVADSSTRSRYLRSFGSIDDLMGLAFDTELEVVDPLQLIIDVESAARLGLPDDHVGRIKFVRVHNDLPFCITTVFLPPDLSSRVGAKADLAHIGSRDTTTVIGIVDQLIGAPGIVTAKQSVTATLADPRLASELLVRPESPVLRIDRLYLDSDEKPVELAVGFYASDRYSYRLELRRHRD